MVEVSDSARASELEELRRPVRPDTQGEVDALRSSDPAC